MSYVLISLFIGFVFLVVWADRREELWDTLRSKYSTARTSSIRSPSEPIHILRSKRKQKSWLNAMHVQIKDSGLARAHEQNFCRRTGPARRVR